MRTVDHRFEIIGPMAEDNRYIADACLQKNVDYSFNNSRVTH
jgi:hypothetical protein